MAKKTGLILDTAARKTMYIWIIKITSWARAIAMIFGTLCLVAVDTLMSGIALSMMFTQADFLLGPPIDGIVAGFVMSFACLVITSYSWDKLITSLQSGQTAIEIIKKLWLGLLMATFIMFLDGNLDISPLLSWVQAGVPTSWSNIGSPFPFWSDVYQMAIWSVTWFAYILFLFGELYTAFLINGISEEFQALGNTLKRLQEKR